MVTIVRESTDSSNGGQDVKSTDQYTRDEEGRLQSWSHGWYYDEYGADDIYSLNVCLDEVPDGMCIIAGTNDDGSARIASVIAWLIGAVIAERIASRGKAGVFSLQVFSVPLRLDRYQVIGGWIDIEPSQRVVSVIVGDIMFDWKHELAVLLIRLFTVPSTAYFSPSSGKGVMLYYDEALTQEYQTPEIEWPEDGSTTVYVKSGDPD